MKKNQPRSMMGIESPTASHLPVLERALAGSEGLVIEHGAGLYSTPLLARSGRAVLCVEPHAGWREWASWIYEGKAEMLDSWKAVVERLGDAGVLFVDGPAHERGPLIQAALDRRVPFIVAHDTNQPNWHHYGLQPHMFTASHYAVSHTTPETHQTTLWALRS